MSSRRDARPDEPERVVIRDNRKIDPVTGEARKRPAGGAQVPPAAADGGVNAAPDAGQPTAQSPGEDDVFNTDAFASAGFTSDAFAGKAHTDDVQPAVPQVDASLLEERTRDLQRVQAEYANYRKRADRDRLAASDLAIGRTIVDLLPIVDDLDRAKAHGDLTGPLKALADKLDGVFTKLGLDAFGEIGDPFDPAIHEAVMHDESAAVTVPTCTTVLRQGYRHRDRLLRPAMVGVSDPASPAAPETDADFAPDLATTDTVTDSTAATPE